MKLSGKTLAFVGALVMVPALALAQTKAPAKAAKPAASAPAKPAATHSTSGIVKSTDATSLVIAKTAKDTKTTTFVVNASTVTKGTLAAGARVEVRYRTEGKDNIATAITVAAPKAGKGMPKSGK